MLEPLGALVAPPDGVVGPVAGLFCGVLGAELEAPPRVVASCANAGPPASAATAAKTKMIFI